MNPDLTRSCKRLSPSISFPSTSASSSASSKLFVRNSASKKIVELLARAGLHLGKTTVARMLQQPKVPPPESSPPRTMNRESAISPLQSEIRNPRSAITSCRPNHVWHVDLALVPTAIGMCCSWLPFALPQCWPFCWWLAFAEDYFSRRVMGHAVFFKPPTSERVRAFLGRTMHHNQAKPRYIICDLGCQFDCDGFRNWCKRRNVKPRYGAVGKHGSIAVIERCILTIKLLLDRLPIIPLQREAMRNEVGRIIQWYNAHRPHHTLAGKTTKNTSAAVPPISNRASSRAPTTLAAPPCARPQALVKGQPGAQLELVVTHHHGRKHALVGELSRSSNLMGSAQARKLASALESASIPAKLYGGRETTHSKINNDIGVADDPGTKGLIEFLSEVLK